jgi:hypothetical protein
MPGRCAREFAPAHEQIRRNDYADAVRIDRDSRLSRRKSLRMRRDIERGPDEFFTEEMIVH